jgi:hypothetical protein
MYKIPFSIAKCAVLPVHFSVANPYRLIFVAFRFWHLARVVPLKQCLQFGYALLHLSIFALQTLLVRFVM